MTSNRRRPKRDPLTKSQRSYCMSRIRSKDTKIELLVRSALHKNGLRFRKHVKGLPGKPDIVFPKARVVVLIDGNFWHGFQFKSWQARLSPRWREKISGNIRRDRENIRSLRAMGWRVIRLWEEQTKKNFDATIERVAKIVKVEAKKRLRPIVTR